MFIERMSVQVSSRNNKLLGVFCFYFFSFAVLFLPPAPRCRLCVVTLSSVFLCSSSSTCFSFATFT